MADQRQVIRHASHQPGRIGGSNRLLSMKEAAELLHTSYKHFARSYKAWGIAFSTHADGGSIFFQERDIQSFVERRRKAA